MISSSLEPLTLPYCVMIMTKGMGDNAKCYGELQGNESWGQVNVSANRESLVTLD